MTQTFTCHTTYMFSISGSKTCLETSGPGKKIVEMHTEKVNVGRAFFFLESGREKLEEEKKGVFHVKYSVSE